MLGLGLSTSAISWFSSYLSNRCHITRVKDSCSTPGFPTSGVPQGSILGPTLFSAFINDLPSSLFPDSTVLFADDTTIHIASDNHASIESSLQQSLDLAHLWLLANGLRINASKTKSMLLHSSRKSPHSSLKLQVADSPVEQVRSFKFLRVVVNDTLTWNDHIDLVCKKVSRHLNLLRRLSWFLPQHLLLLYLKSYILPIFDYCDVVWFGCTKSDSHHLDLLLNFSCRTVLRRRKYSSASSARRDLGISTLSSRRKVHVVQTVFKCLSSNSPSCLSSIFPPSTSSHFTRSSTSSQLNLPQTRSSFGQKAFSFAGAALWRSLPTNIRAMKNYRAFTLLAQDFLLT